MQWMVPRQKLGESQVHVLDSCLRTSTGNSWVKGFAGSGKTVLLVHAIVEAKTRNPQLSVCVVVYTHALKDLVRTGIPEHLGQIPVMTYHAFRNNPHSYDLIVVDEIQDLETDVLQLLTRHTKRLIVAGDEDQSIYVDRISSADIDRLISPTKHNLEVLYRLTQALRDIVRTILPNSLIETARSDRAATNVQVTLAKATSIEEEVTWVWHHAKRYASAGTPSAILLPKRRLIQRFIDHICRISGVQKPDYPRTEKGKTDYNAVNEHLNRAGLPLQYFGSDFGSLADSDTRPLVYLMTYHSAKGLDYETVFLPNLDSDLEFWPSDKDLDRRLFFVAATRTRRNLYMSYHTVQPHPYVLNMPQALLLKTDCALQLAKQQDDGFHF